MVTHTSRLWSRESSSTGPARMTVLVFSTVRTGVRDASRGGRMAGLGDGVLRSGVARPIPFRDPGGDSGT